jgi:hypothetical protein
VNRHLPHLRVQSQEKNHLGSEEESQSIELLPLQQINGHHCYILQIVKQKHVCLCVLGLLANLKQHARLSEVCLVEATSDNNLSVERISMSN